MSGVERIGKERERQKNEEGWSDFHDDRHEKEELTLAAICYATPHYLRDEVPVRRGDLGEGWVSCSVREADCTMPEFWPFSPLDWKPRDRITELTKAGAFIAAEIDRLERLQRSR